MAKDLATINGCWFLLSLYITLELATSLIPALTLFYEGQLLKIVQVALDTRTVDRNVLFSAALGGFACSIISQLLRYAQRRLSFVVGLRIKAFYSTHMFTAFARLDVPTFEDDTVQRHLESATPPTQSSSIAFNCISAILHFFSFTIRLTSQFLVLVNLLRGQQDAVLMTCISFANTVLKSTSRQGASLHSPDGVWAATTNDQDYIRSEGLKKVVNDPKHRQEIVAGGLGPHLTAQYRQLVSRISDRGGDFYYRVFAMRSNRRKSVMLIEEFFNVLPDVLFALRAIQQPSSIPLSLASLELIKKSTTNFTFAALSFFRQTGQISDKLDQVKQLYEITKIPNRIRVKVPEKSPVSSDDADYGIPFPEDQQSLQMGISVEFRNVSFKYPAGSGYALRNVNFKIERGQLCVVVGNNGSGKSTILKLIARIFDPTEGEIYINDKNINTFRLSDLRRAISVLFQDYTHFPLSIRDNIGLGDPLHASSDSRIRRAAELGGASTFIERLPDKYDTYLERPVNDEYSPTIEGTTNIFGRVVDYDGVRQAAGISTDGGASVSSRGLSGGQMQRVALSRMFMRSVVSEEVVGLLMFDEPSASLDPTAEHDLFQRLRKLRGNKTMIFSSHRFGNLTRHADLILYIHDSQVLEEGQHDELLAHDGEYARIWKLQAQAFL